MCSCITYLQRQRRQAQSPTTHSNKSNNQIRTLGQTPSKASWYAARPAFGHAAVMIQDEKHVQTMEFTGNSSQQNVSLWMTLQLRHRSPRSVCSQESAPCLNKRRPRELLPLLRLRRVPQPRAHQVRLQYCWIELTVARHWVLTWRHISC